MKLNSNSRAPYLGGEITLEIDSLIPPEPVWKIILKSNDPAKLSATISTILTAAHMRAQFSEEDGVTYHTVQIPSPQNL